MWCDVRHNCSAFLGMDFMGLIHWWQVSRLPCGKSGPSLTYNGVYQVFSDFYSKNSVLDCAMKKKLERLMENEYCKCEQSQSGFSTQNFITSFLPSPQCQFGLELKT